MISDKQCNIIAKMIHYYTMLFHLEERKEMKMTEKVNWMKQMTRHLNRIALTGSLVLAAGLLMPASHVVFADAEVSIADIISLENYFAQKGGFLAIAKGGATTVSFPRLPLNSPDLSQPAGFSYTAASTTLVSPDLSLPAGFADTASAPALVAPDMSLPAGFADTASTPALVAPDMSLPAGFADTTAAPALAAPDMSLPSGFADTGSAAALVSPDMSLPSGFADTGSSAYLAAPDQSLPSGFVDNSGIATYEQLASGGGY